MNEAQRAFLEQLAMRIPALFEAISNGNVKSEYIIGVRHVGKRQVRLKLVAEVVEPGQSRLHTHSVLRPVDVSSDELAAIDDDDVSNAPRRQDFDEQASKRRSPRKR